MDLTAATPVEIDTQLAEIDRRLFVARQTLANAERRAAYYRDLSSDEARRSHMTEAQVAAAHTAHNEWVAAQDAISALEQAAAPLNAEYARRPWPRAWMVLNTNGHAHSTHSCSTTFPTTVFGWLPEVAGLDRPAMMAELGVDACQTCYPENKATHPRRTFTHQEKEAQAARDAKKTAADAKAAKRAAAAITNPDGTPLVRNPGGRHADRVDTERAAQSEYMQAVEDAHYAELRNTEETDPERIARNNQLAREYLADAGRYLAALAAKRHPDLYATDPAAAVDAEGAALAKKAAARTRQADKAWADNAEERAYYRARDNA